MILIFRSTKLEKCDICFPFSVANLVYSCIDQRYLWRKLRIPSFKGHKQQLFAAEFVSLFLRTCTSDFSSNGIYPFRSASYFSTISRCLDLVQEEEIRRGKAFDSVAVTRIDVLRDVKLAMPTHSWWGQIMAFDLVGAKKMPGSYLGLALLQLFLPLSFLVVRFSG